MRLLIPLLRRHVAALRILIALTVLTGVLYPALVTAIAQLPGLSDRANGSTISLDGRTVGSSLLGQNFTDEKGQPLEGYFQPRPSDAGATGYDPTASGAGNLGPESVVDTLANPAVPGSTTKLSLLSQVCSRSVAVGALEHVDGSRPYCTATGVGAVLAVFHRGPSYTGPVTRAVSVNQACPAVPFLARYDGVTVVCAVPGTDYSSGQIVPVRGPAPAVPVVPPDAVTASGSGLDPDISPAYASLQEARVARVRGVPVATIAAAVARHTVGRSLGFMGEPAVDVLALNVDLDEHFPLSSR